MEDEVYRELARHLDEMPVGAPMSDELLEILRHLFTPEEAALAARLPFMNTSLDELSRLLSRSAEELEAALDAMALKGTVFRSSRDGVKRYRLLPTMVGFSETPFWPGKDTPLARRLAPLWMKYLASAWGSEIADRELPLVRAVPVEEDISPGSEILPFETVRELVEEAEYRAVAYCPCRQMKAYLGEGCEHERENCFHFGSMGRYMVEHGMGREVSLQQAVRIMEDAHEAGLVFTVDNHQGRISTLCCCCGCCCVFMHSRKTLGFENAMSPSSYVARVARKLCLGCGECEERCPVGAIALDEHELAAVDESQCLGCGVCVPNCTGEALTLRRRKEPEGIPTLDELFS